VKVFFQIISLLPGIISAVRNAEEFVPISGQGRAKLDFILGILTDLIGDVSGIIEPITKVINRIVSLANATGIFQKAPPAV